MKQGITIIIICFLLAGMFTFLSFKVNNIYILGAISFMILSVVGIFPIADEEQQEYAKKFISEHEEKCYKCGKKITYNKGGWTIPATRAFLSCNDCYDDSEFPISNWLIG